MKLNIGCGYGYLPGWTNVDADAACRPDVEALAWDLPFDPACAEEAKALQLVEHLGFFKTKYFLSECWRVLAPGGRLTLETPDIEKTFRVFLDGGRADREAALGWIYGAETAGMGHLYCFPKELLSELLSGAGFGPAEVSEFLYQPARPAVRFSAVKETGEKAALNAALRRRLLDAGLPCFGSEVCAAGQEAVIAAVLEAHGSPERVFEQALFSAPLAFEYFQLAGENERKEAPFASACERLAAWGLQPRLAAVLLSEAGAGRGPGAAYEAALAFGRLALEAASNGKALPAGPPPEEGAPPVFSRLTADDWLGRRERLRSRGDLPSRG